MQEQLAVPHHQQDTDVYCGAACAQMVLRALGGPFVSQVDLYNDNHNHSVEPAAWASPPDGVCWTMNSRQAAKRFTLDATDAEESISRAICWAIHRYQCAPIALVHGGGHWVVVRGFSASAAPTAAHDTSYAIQSFDIRDPWPPAPVPPGPPPHADGDVCGSGGVRGVADINISYVGWKQSYLTANTFGAKWLDMFVAVCDPDPPGLPGPPVAPKTAAALERRPRFDGRRLLEPGVVRDDLAANLRDAGLMAHPTWSRVFADLRTAEPLRVERLDRPNEQYWIVPTVDARGKLRGAVGVDAFFGDYQQAMAIPDPGASPFAFADAARATEHVQGRRFDLPRGAGSLLVRRQDVAVHPALVWRPCRESLSPFYPFRMIAVGTQRLYVRAFDGAVFTALTHDLGGL